ncbi:carbohydrate sulfotransferase 11-like [Acropora palmata]|uniref:carbohydrate sulfotransferase 11-like n=1 Tax=Acropora palmata TaxID=6131 RepID=UPI003DA0E298
MVCLKNTPITRFCIIYIASIFLAGVFFICGPARDSFSAFSAKYKEPIHRKSYLDIDQSNVADIETIDDYADPERRQREIQQNVRTHCQRYGQNSTFPDLRNFYVVDSPPLLYCLMPKSASRQWRGLLSKIGPRKRLSMSQLDAKDIEQYFSKSFKFMFVREPFERLLSSYKDKFVARRTFDRPLLKYYGAKILLRFRPNVTNKSLESLDDITFPEFVEYIIKDGVNEGFDRHWNHYIDQCNPCLIKYDFIGRYEYLAEDGNYMLRKAGEDRIRFPKEKPFDTREELLSYYSQIPLDWILDLGRIYRSNFEMFGYSFPGSLQPIFQNAVLPSHRDFPYNDNYQKT